MTKIKEEKGNLLQMRVAPKFRKMLKEIADDRMCSLAEAIRYCVLEYYNGEFRKQKLGYFAGHDSAARRGKKATIQEALDSIELMSDEDLTTYIHSSGLIRPEDEELGAFFARTDEATGIRMIAFKYRDQASTSDRWTMGELRKELEKHLREQMKENK